MHSYSLQSMTYLTCIELRPLNFSRDKKNSSNELGAYRVELANATELSDSSPPDYHSLIYTTES